MIVACWISPAAGQSPGPPSPRQAAEALAAETQIHGAPAAFGPIDQGEETLLGAGTQLRQSPALRSPISDVVDVATIASIAERRGAWIRVRWNQRAGWALLAEPDQWGDDVVPLDALPAELIPSPVSPERLAAAHRHLGVHESAAFRGTRTDTDIGSKAIVKRLVALLEHLDDDVAERYGVVPVPPEREAIVVFASGAAFRDFVEEDDAERAGSTHLGQAHGGLATLSAERLSVLQLEALFVHEVAHLSVRRALGLGLPPWLEEGIAEDLSFHRRDDSGRLLAGSLSQSPPRRLSERVNDRGSLIFTSRRLSGTAAYGELRSAFAQGAEPGLESLVTMDGPAFYSGKDPLRYARSAFFVRYLLTDHASGFASYLGAVSRGDEASAHRLLAHLASSGETGDHGALLTWSDLDHRFRAWIAQSRRSR